MARPPLILYDSPTAGLDPITAYRIIALVIQERDTRNATSIVVTHHIQDGYLLETTPTILKRGNSHASWSLDTLSAFVSSEKAGRCSWVQEKNFGLRRIPTCPDSPANGFQRLALSPSPFLRFLDGDFLPPRDAHLIPLSTLSSARLVSLEFRLSAMHIHFRGRLLIPIRIAAASYSIRQMN